MRVSRILGLLVALVLVASCGATPSGQGGGLKVLALETFLADMAQNVAGDRLTVDVLLPAGVDPHSFEPVPADLAKVAESDVLIMNGGGLEVFLDRMLQNAGGQRSVIDCSAGLAPRQQQAGEPEVDEHGGDPHFWLDPVNAQTYVRNIRDGLSKADPAGAPVYAANADAYIKKLGDLDAWIREQVKLVPEQNRLLVTNHESMGYFADRYGFSIVGTILASVSTDASPSAQELVALVKSIRQTGAKAIFLETGTNPQLANQVAQETGVKVAPELYTHSASADGQTLTYIEMMKHNVTVIVNTLR